jgi:DNA-binding response OmpR family regulator
MIFQNDFTILYVEDDKNLREIYVQFLKLYFKNVYEACDGEEALEKYSLYKPNIAILDINIPKINGLKVAKKIREDNDDIILIMLTAYSDTEKLLDAIELNLTKYLIKPIKTFELEDILSESISKLHTLKKSRNIISLNCNFQWDKETKQLYSKEHHQIKLTKKEYLLIKLFCENKHKIFSNEDILNCIWEDEDDTFNPNKLRILFSKLKTKLSCNLFDSIYNVGYKLKGNF